MAGLGNFSNRQNRNEYDYGNGDLGPSVSNSGPLDMTAKVPSASPDKTASTLVSKGGILCESQF